MPDPLNVDPKILTSVADHVLQMVNTRNGTVVAGEVYNRLKSKISMFEVSESMKFLVRLGMVEQMNTKE